MGSHQNMSIFSNLFNKKKELQGQDIESLLKALSVNRDPVIVKTETFKFVTDILAYDQKTFHLKNTLSRDEVLYNLKAKELNVLLPYELTMYGGQSRLMGLGMVSGMHTLKLAAPNILSQQESRGAYRVSRFPEQPSVTFSTDNLDLVKCRLNDISMTGAGLRLDPRWERGNAKLTARTSLILDIRINDQLRVSTTASVRYLGNLKAGVQFDELSKTVKDRLFKFIVEQRREEQRALIRVQESLASAPAQNEDINKPVAGPEGGVKKATGKPTALVVTDREKYSEFLTSALGRKFDLLYSTPSITDIRNHLGLHPNICLIDLKEESQEQVAQMRKASTLLPPGCVLMFFGRAFTHTFRHRFESLGYPTDILVELNNAKKLLVFKQIQAYYTARARE